MSKQAQKEEDQEAVQLVNWSAFRDANVLTPEEVKLMQDISSPDLSDDNALKTVAKTVFENAQAYIPTLFKILREIHQEQPVRYVLHVFSSIFDVESFSLAAPETDWKGLKESMLKSVFDQSGDGNSDNKSKLYTCLFQFMDRDPFMVTRALRILTRIFDYEYRREPLSVRFNSDYETLLFSIGTVLRESKHRRGLKAAINALSAAIRKEQCRDMFYKQGGISNLFVAFDMFSTDVQVIYEICFCIWVMSFAHDRIGLYFQDSKVVPKLHNVLRNVQTEKVIRVILSTFKNFIDNATMIADMVNLGVPKTLANMEKRNFEDEDIRKDMISLKEALENHIEEITSFDEYRQEVLSGNLDWSPVHTSEKFWRENIQKFEEQDFYILKELIKLLDSRNAVIVSATPADEVTAVVEDKQAQHAAAALTRDVKKILQIACHDIGQFVRFHPRGRKLVTQYGGKDKVIQIMADEAEDPEVKKYALLATQKIMITHWDYLEK